MPKQITMVRWSATNIPYGVAFDENTGIFSGTPANAGDYVVPVTVETNYGKDTKDVAIGVEDLKNVWRLIPVHEAIENSVNLSIYNCVDNGEEIIFFGNISSCGVFFTYNPKSSTYSDIYKLIDGTKYSGEIISGTAFKSCIQDPISKKWLAFFGKNYVRTSSGIKDLGSNIDLTSITTCWAGNLQKFCVIGRASNGSLTSYLFDINGNIIDKSSAINLVSNFDIATNSYDVSICWSDTENKFVAVSYQGTNSGVVAYSSDGLNWNSTKISGLVSGYPLGPVSWNEKFNAFVLAAKNYIYTSPDGITWTRIKTFSDFTIYEMAWSESKQTLCIAGTNYVSYITKDLAEWEKLSMPAAINPSGKTIWSNTVNGFIATPAFTNKGFLRLKI